MQLPLEFGARRNDLRHVSEDEVEGKMNPWRAITKFKTFGARLKNTRLHDKRTEYQLQEISVLRKIVGAFSVDCVFDIGANQGQYGRMLRKNVGFPGTIISVEPNPEIFCALRSNSKSDKKWRSENIALAGHDGEQCLSIMAGDQFTSLSDPIGTNVSSVSDLNTVTKQINVPVKTLKTFYLDAKRVSHFTRPFLKMDTQGYDSVIVQSAGETIRQFIGIQTELSFVRLYSDSISFYESFDLYRQLGFTLCAIAPNNAGHFPYLIEQDAVFLNDDFLGSCSALK
jgi:FkbM family methyltransferase